MWPGQALEQLTAVPQRPTRRHDGRQEPGGRHRLHDREDQQQTPGFGTVSFERGRQAARQLRRQQHQPQAMREEDHEPRERDPHSRPRAVERRQHHRPPPHSCRQQHARGFGVARERLQQPRRRQHRHEGRLAFFGRAQNASHTPETGEEHHRERQRDGRHRVGRGPAPARERGGAHQAGGQIQRLRVKRLGPLAQPGRPQLVRRFVGDRAHTQLGVAEKVHALPQGERQCERQSGSERSRLQRGRHAARSAQR